MRPIRIALADGRPLLVSAFEALLNAQPDMEVVAVSADGRQAVETTQRIAVDVLLIDIRMPVMDGVEATRLLSVVDDRPFVIVLTSFHLDDLVLSAVRAGARGFLLKDTDPDDLLHAIRTVHGGEAVIAPAAIGHLLDDYRRESGRAETRPPEVRALLDRLTDRELLVFRLVAAGKNDTEIGAELVIAETTVEAHVGRLLMKLQCRDRVALVVLAHAAGSMA